MVDFLTFRRLITPMLIHAIVWLGVVLSFITGVVLIVKGLDASYGGGQMVLGGILTVVLGPLFSRIWGEKTTVLFRTYDKVCGESTSGKPPTP